MLAKKRGKGKIFVLCNRKDERGRGGYCYCYCYCYC